MILLNDINPKEYLLKLQRLNTNINQKIAELDSLRLMCTSIKWMCDLSGFEIVGRIVLKDKTTGKIYR